MAWFKYRWERDEEARPWERGTVGTGIGQADRAEAEEPEPGGLREADPLGSRRPPMPLPPNPMPVCACLARDRGQLRDRATFFDSTAGLSQHPRPEHPPSHAGNSPGASARKLPD